MSIFGFKFIREGERLHRELSVVSELAQITLDNPHLSGSDKDDATLQTIKDTTGLMTDHIIFLHEELIKSKGINLALSGGIVIYCLTRWMSK